MGNLACDITHSGSKRRSPRRFTILYDILGGITSPYVRTAWVVPCIGGGIFALKIDIVWSLISTEENI